MAPQWTKGKIIGQEGGGSVTFHYNPQMVKVGKNAKWSHLQAAGREQPILEYGCGDPITYSFEMDLSRTGGENFVKEQVEGLIKLTKPTVKGAGVDRPPKVQLILGSAVSATCVIVSVNGTYGPIYNPQSLTPYTGKVGITLETIQP